MQHWSALRSGYQSSSQFKILKKLCGYTWPVNYSCFRSRIQHGKEQQPWICSWGEEFWFSWRWTLLLFHLKLQEQQVLVALAGGNAAPNTTTPVQILGTRGWREWALVLCPPPYTEHDWYQKFQQQYWKFLLHVQARSSKPTEQDIRKSGISIEDNKTCTRWEKWDKHFIVSNLTYPFTRKISCCRFNNIVHLVLKNIYVTT